MLGYLSQAGPHHPKHGGSPRRASPAHHKRKSNFLFPPLHPTLALIVHYAIAIPSTFLVHDAFFSDSGDAHSKEEDELLLLRQIAISKMLLVYTLGVFTTRYLSSCHAGRLRHHSVLYEMTWLCNTTLVMGCLSFAGGGPAHGGSWLLRRRPLVATAYCVAVSVDQLLWYVDLVGWAVAGAFPVGVMKYLAWPQTAWIDRCTCTHHLWTMPLLAYGAGTQPLGALPLSAYVVVAHVALSRWLTPRCVRDGDATSTGRGRGGGDDENDPRRYRYLNVNLSHELWRDISFPFLQISRDNPPGHIYLFRLLWRWQLFNGLMFIGILRPMSELFLK